MRPTKNASYVAAGFYSALVTMFGSSWYFLLSLASALTSGRDVGNVIGDTILGAFVCWIFLTFVFYEIGRMFDDMNEEGRKRMEEREREEAQRAQQRRDEDDNKKR
jgi:hypothetical protein